MSFTKIQYVDNETIITADNLNNIQDAIINNEENIVNNFNTLKESIDTKSNNGLNLTKKVGNPYNLLDNSDFTNPVNQRGSSSYLGSGYTIDRWRTPAALQVDVLPGCISLTCTSTSMANGFRQFLEKSPTIGTMFTFALEEDNGIVHVGSAAFPESDYVIAFTTADGITGRLYASGDSNVSVCIMVPIGKSIHVKWVALYEGEYTAETLPKYQPKGYGAELTECFRYFRRLKSTYQPVAIYVSRSNTILGTLIFLGIPMRAKPTITIVESPSTLRYKGTTVTLSNFEYYDTLASTNELITIRFSVDNSLTNGYMGYFTSYEFELSADL